MNTTAMTMVHAKVPIELKNDAKEVLSNLGVSLSLLVEQAMRDIVATKKLIIEQPLKPTAFLENILESVEEDIRNDNKNAFSPAFDNAEDMDAYLDNYVARCK